MGAVLSRARPGSVSLACWSSTSRGQAAIRDWPQGLSAIVRPDLRRFLSAW